MTIGNKIKNLRKLNKMTQMELAAKANISRSYLADIERDRYNASLDTLKSIASALNVNINEFFDNQTDLNIENPIDYFWEQYLKALGYEIIYDLEGNVILDTSIAQYEISELDIKDLHKSTNSFIKFKLSEIMNKSREISNQKDTTIPIAAHNDYSNDELQQKLMKEDLDEL